MSEPVRRRRRQAVAPLEVLDEPVMQNAVDSQDAYYAQDTAGSRDAYGAQNAYYAQNQYHPQDAYSQRNAYRPQDEYDMQDAYNARNARNRRDAYDARAAYDERDDLNAPVVQVSAAAPTAPVGQLKANKGLIKFILLSFLTFGIYGLVVMSSVSNDINIIASRYDGKKTMHFCLLFFLVGPLTLGIAFFVWNHKIAARIGNELKRRRISYHIGAADFWLWNVLGSLIVIGPFVYLHKLLKATNLICEHYNVNG